jgi:hypothetical protein
MNPQRHISNCQQYPDFRWAEFRERELKDSHRIGRQMRLARQHDIPTGVLRS